MNIYNYIDDYGIYSFKEKEFNEVDSMIFAFLSYTDFENILENGKRLTIQEIGRIHLGLHPKKDKDVMAVKEANKLLRYIKDTKRYKNCIISNYEYIGNEEIQFGAISIEYKENHVFISFEGTNQLFSGWKENFLLSYEFPTKSHQMAIHYLNKYYTFSKKQLIIGGHSKGGNLALVAGMYANILVRSKIKSIYSGDGPGLLEKEFQSKRYRECEKKYIHIIPDYSLVGLLLNHSNDKVIKSNNTGILAHNIIYWEVEKCHFKKSTLSPLSKELDSELKKWFQEYKEEDKKEFVENLNNIMKKAQVYSILDLKENHKNIIKIIYETKNISNNTKKILIDFLGICLKCIRNTKTEEFKEELNHFKIRKH